VWKYANNISQTIPLDVSLCNQIIFDVTYTYLIINFLRAAILISMWYKFSYVLRKTDNCGTNKTNYARTKTNFTYFIPAFAFTLYHERRCVHQHDALFPFYRFHLMSPHSITLHRYRQAYDFTIFIPEV